MHRRATVELDGHDRRRRRPSRHALLDAPRPSTAGTRCRTTSASSSRRRRPGFAAVTAADADRLAGYAQVAAINDTVQRRARRRPRPPGRAGDRPRACSAPPSTSSAATAAVRSTGGCSTPTADRRRAGRGAGLRHDRELLPDAPAAADRPRGRRRDPAVRARARRGRLARRQQPGVRGAPRAGRLDARHARQREAEPWFDPAGFLLHERDGRLAGVLLDQAASTRRQDPALGEIYVIAVDPDFQGLGLGKPAHARRARLDRRPRHRRPGCSTSTPTTRRPSRCTSDLGFARPPHRPRLHRPVVPVRRERHRATASTASDARRAPRRRAPLPRRPGVARALRRTSPARRDDEPAARRCATASTTSCPTALELVTESVSDRGDTVKFLWALDGGRPGRDRADAVPRPGDGVRVQPGRVRDGVRLLRHRARPGSPATSTAGEIVEQVVRAARRARDGGRRVSATSCSWGWASRSPTRPPSGAPSSGCTAISACRPATSRSRRSASCRASAASPNERAAGQRSPVSLHAANDDAPRRAGADQPPLPARRPARRVRRLPGRQRPPAQLRVGADRRRQRPAVATPPSWPRWPGRLRPAPTST